MSIKTGIIFLLLGAGIDLQAQTSTPYYNDDGLIS